MLQLKESSPLRYRVLSSASHFLFRRWIRVSSWLHFRLWGNSVYNGQLSISISGRDVQSSSGIQWHEEFSIRTVRDEESTQWGIRWEMSRVLNLKFIERHAEFSLRYSEKYTWCISARINMTVHSSQQETHDRYAGFSIRKAVRDVKCFHTKCCGSYVGFSVQTSVKRVRI